MELVLLFVGLSLGALIVYLFYQIKAALEREQANAELVEKYESRIRDLERQHRVEIRRARKESTDQSRAVLKGKMAEQIAPMLPGFDYWPSDARFLGDPVDYVVFNGYSEIKDAGLDGEDLEIIILDIKQGRAHLTQGQRQIAKALQEGRVRFEVVRVLNDGTVRSYVWRARRK